MSKPQILLLTLLVLSLGLNGWLFLRPDPPATTKVEPNNVSHRAGRSPAQSIQPTAGLTDTEARSLNVAQINSDFTHERDEFRTIRDPWLTIDEIYKEGLARFEKINAAEQRRRDSLEETTGKPWSRIDLELGWSKMEILLNMSALLADQAGEAAYAVTAVIAAGAREVGLEKSNPFDISTPTQAEAIRDIVIRHEEKLREQLDDDQFHQFFTPFVMMTMEDVRGLSQRFGREATEEEREILANFLMPEHPLAEIIHRTTVSEGHFHRDLLEILRPIMDDDTFAHLLAYQKHRTDGYDWTPAKRLQIFDLETQRDRDGLEAILNDRDLQSYQASKRGAWLSTQEESTQ